MRSIRVIARLDVKSTDLVKTVQLEGLRKVGLPHVYAEKYYKSDVDEILYLDIVASLYRRSNLTNIIHATTQNIFVPVSAGGGLRSIDDCRSLLQNGADKVTINTYAVENPNILEDISKLFGSQATVLYIEAKYSGNGRYEVYTDCGREASGLDVTDWFREAQDLGVGEVVLTSIDREGTRQGFDTQLINKISKLSHIPIISSGGFGTLEHGKDAVIAGADAIAIADCLHYERYSILEIKQYLRQFGLSVRI